ncbi:MAG TPA: glycosyltransferase family 9 protein, partial [Pseudonocardiaceae bacterium]
RLVLSADTGVAHLASACRTPSVVLFGPAEPRRWGPPPEGPHTVLTHAELRRGEPFADDPDPALLAVTVDEALAACRERLAAGPGRTAAGHGQEGSSEGHTTSSRTSQPAG